MSDLQVDASQLREVSTQITAAVSVVQMETTLTRPADGVLGCSEVSAALHDTAIQQRVRADLTASALRAVGLSPAQAAKSITEADAALARAF